MSKSRKREDTLISLGHDTDKLLVLKSRPLAALWQSDLTLAEFKILDTYLGRINSHDPGRRMVTFSKGELETLLGVKKINIADLKQRLTHLMSSVVELPDQSVKKGFRLVTLFEEAVAEQDLNEQWTVKLECTSKAMKYFFNVESLGYFRYKLRCITSLKSRYAYILFVYLEQHRFKKTWDVGVDELKHILACDKEECYKKYKVFNDRLLKRVQKEILEKTECRYSYESVKTGRTVTAVRFTIETLPKAYFEDNDYDPNQITIEDYLEKSAPAELWETAVKDFDFTVEQLEEIRSILVTIPDQQLPDDPTCCDSIDLRRYHYIRIKVAEIKRRDADKPIKSKFAYLIKMLKQDL